MSIFDAILLGLTQGLTEFLPVSSTGHLILIRDIFGITSGNNLAFDATLHLATLLAVGLYFRKDILSLIQTAFRWVLRKEITLHDKTFLQAVILGSIPAAVLGFFLQDVIENVFRHSLVVAMGLCLGTLLMQYAESHMKQNQEALTAKKGFSIGWFQALALIPGISRSGATISGGLLAGLAREQATRFAFVLSFPVLLGAGLFSLSDLSTAGAGGISNIVIGCITAFLAGLGAIHFLVEFLKRRGLSVFIWYRILLAATIVILVATGVLA